MGYLVIVAAWGNSCVYVYESACKIDEIVLVRFDPSIDTSNGSLDRQSRYGAHGLICSLIVFRLVGEEEKIIG